MIPSIEQQIERSILCHFLLLYAVSFTKMSTEAYSHFRIVDFFKRNFRNFFLYIKAFVQIFIIYAFIEIRKKYKKRVSSHDELSQSQNADMEDFNLKLAFRSRIRKLCLSSLRQFSHFSSTSSFFSN